jgi:hypothetical protein
VIRVLHYRSEGPTPRRATVMLSSADLPLAEEVLGVKWTGLENAREVKEKLRKKKLLAKKSQPGSAAGTHFVQGGLPELGRRR